MKYLGNSAVLNILLPFLSNLLADHPFPLPATPVLQSALSTMLGDDKNGKGEAMTAEIWFYGLSLTRRGRETHPEAMGRRGRKGVSIAKGDKGSY